MVNRRLVVVLGMHRSGTSALTRGLQVMGVGLGDRLMPSVKGNNDKGFWEDVDLNALNIEMLNALGSDWHHLAPIEPGDVEALRRDGFFLRAVELLRRKLDTPLFGFKDPRVAKLLSFWKAVFDDCQLDVAYVLAVRHPLSVVTSLGKRDGLDAEKSYLLWLGHLISSLAVTSGERRVLVDYDRLMQAPDHELGRVAQCLGQEIDGAELHKFKSDFIDQGLRHSVYDLEDLARDDACPPLAREIYAVLLDVASDKMPDNGAELSKLAACWAGEFERLKSPLRLVDRLCSQQAEATQIISERDGQVAALNKAVVERDEQVAALNQSVAERDEQIAGLGSRMAEIERRLSFFIAEDERAQRVLWRKLVRRLRLLNWSRKLADSPLFDARWYREHYPDVVQQGKNPLRHYLACGWKEGRQPGPEFDGNYYLARYPDSPRGMPPLVHYWLHGRREGRRMNSALDLDWQHAREGKVTRATGGRSDAKEGAGTSAPDEVLVSVIIPTYNRVERLPELIEAWREVHACTDFSYEIIFSDDGSSDGSAEYLEKVRGLPLKVLHNPHGGASSARNAAIRAAGGERLLIIGDDIYPDPDILNIHLRLGKELGPRVATLGVVDWHPRLAVNHLMHHITEIGNEQFSYNRLKDGSYVDFRHFYTCNVCIDRRLVLEEEAIFDERFDEYGFEDIELAYRLSLRGMKLYFTGAARGAHYHPYTAANFCRRQISAGKMAVVFAGIHPSLSHILGIDVAARKARALPAKDALWQKRLDILVRRCEEYEHVVSVLPRDVSMGIRQCLSMLYTHLFRAMFEYGILLKLADRPNALAVAMERHFGGFGANYWTMLEKRENSAIELAADELYNLGEALNTGDAGSLAYGSKQRAAFDGLMQTKALTAMGFAATNRRRWAHLASRVFYYLIHDPRHLMLRMKQAVGSRRATSAIAAAPTRVEDAIPGLVVDADNSARDVLVAAYRNLFGESARVYLRGQDNLLAPLLADGGLGAPADAATGEATVLFWPASEFAWQHPDHLYGAYVALVENGLSIALISHSLSLGQTVWVGALRDHMVFSRDVAQAILSGQVGNVPQSGKVLRLLPASGNVHEQNLEVLFGAPVDLDADGFFTLRSNGAAHEILRYKVPYLPVRAKTKPVIFVFPIFLAVGGVERNTVEIMRQLNDQFDFVVITMERLRPEQGSLAAQAIEVSAKVIEMSEIVRHADYLRVLARLKVNLQPDLLWVCNGSPWFCDNAAGIRQIFHDVPIVDQEVYDVEQGWISRYGEAGIKSFDAFVAVNRKIQERFLRDFMIAPERTYLIYSAIDTLRIRRFKQSQPDAGLLRAKFGLPDGKRIFTFIARLTPQKRPLEFLKLAKHRQGHEEECFVLVGDGELAQQALDYIERHALGNVVRIPYVENTLELHALSDGIIFTSAYEGLPIAMIEALAMGVPAFSTDVGDIADVLAEYGGGAVVPVTSSSNDVHQAFIDWLGRCSGFAANLRLRENDILERFSSKNIAQQYVDCWRMAMNRFGRDAL